MPAARLALVWVVTAAVVSTGSPRADDSPVAHTSVTVVGTDAARATAIATHAERVRRRAFAELLGDSAPTPWAELCVIHVHATPSAFAAAVGGPPDFARGATSIEFVGDQVISRRIDVMGDGIEPIPDAIAHEMVHVVLAEVFRSGPPPRWADEGLAVLFDDAGKQAGHESDFRAAYRKGRAFAGGDLLTLDLDPSDVHRQRVFYGQSAALVRWMISRRDAATFVRFVVNLQTDDFASALRRHYGLDSRTLFNSAWKEVPPIDSLSLDNAEK